MGQANMHSGFPLRGMVSAVLLASLTSAHAASADCPSAVRRTVDAFIAAAGRQDVNAMAPMFTPGASIASAEFNGKTWATASLSADAWLAAVGKAQGAPYQETIRRYACTIDDARLAFVRAETEVAVGGKVQGRDVNYFTLLRDDQNGWRLVSGSFTGKPASRP